MKKIFLFLIFAFFNSILFAQNSGVNGFIRSSTGEKLAYANIYVQNTSNGTVSNQEGKYEFKLPAGKYNLVFQYLGYLAVVKTIEIKDDFQRLDIVLEQQALVLPELVFGGGKEDPAYTIMRKAIAKSKFHLMQIQSYDARIYVKGSGRIVEVPWLLRKKLKEEGIDSNNVFMTESVADLHFEQPNTYREKVIAIRSTGKDNENSSPNGYIYSSFYSPEVVESISPLSPKSFAYYKFHYEGSFLDQGVEINKIKVIPRVRGEGVFEGFIYIIEDKWSIHSLNLTTVKMGFNFNMKQIYAAVEAKIAWMPVSHRFEVNGSFYGFKVEYNYVATAGNYKIVLNPSLVDDIKIIDENVEKERAKKISPLKFDKKENTEEELGKILSEKKELTRKDMKKMVREMEKLEEKERAEKKPDSVDIVSNRSIKIDSLARKKTIDFWNETRPVPLTAQEIKSEIRADSLKIVDAVKNKEKQEKDSLGNKKKKESDSDFFDILGNKSWKMGKKTATYLEYQSPITSPTYNTVEGFAFNFGLGLRGSNSQKIENLKNDSTQKIKPEIAYKSWNLMALGRYSFARNVLIGKMTFDYNFGKNRNFVFEGGRFVEQINPEKPISNFVNSITTLFLEQNWLKLYEKDYVLAAYQQKFSDAWNGEISLQFANRKSLTNHSTYRIVERANVAFTPNEPVNASLNPTAFDPHNALTFALKAEYKPFLKYRISNQRKIMIEDSSPIFSFNYRKGIEGIADSKTDFDLIEIGMKHSLKVGRRGVWSFSTKLGAFLNKNVLYFPDFKHFDGNRTPIQTSHDKFRLLDYYQYSTADQYAQILTNYQFRKLLLTQFTALRFMGFKENIFVNYLASPQSKNYMEVGYGFDGILEILRLEAIASFQDGKYLDYGFRIGIVKSFGGINF